MRGENICSSFRIWSKSGSSPHARGKPTDPAVRYATRGLIPACAGKTVGRIAFPTVQQAHPRMRGENIFGNGTIFDAKGSSPHARGKPRAERAKEIVKRLIPACAGKTPPHQPARNSLWAHPRMRGENTDRLDILDTQTGSSPHARGKPLCSLFLVAVLRLIPACAGKTCAYCQTSP